MNNLRQLLVAIAALTLLFSAVSSPNANYFGAIGAFAEDGEDEEDDNNRSSGNDREDNEDEYESDEHSVEATLGDHSKIELGIDNELEEGSETVVMADLSIEVKDGDVPDGEHDVALICGTPNLEKSFDSALVVEDGEGEFQEELALVNGTNYADCQVSIGDVDVDLPDFSVIANASDEESGDDDQSGDHGANSGRGNNGEDDDEQNDQQSDREDDESESHRNDSSIKNEDNGVEIEAEQEVNMADGTYDVQFTCEDPDVNMTIEDSLEVEGGEAHFSEHIELADGTYNDCKVMSGDVVIASFDTLTVAQEEVDDDVHEKRNEKRHEIVTRINAEDEHRRRINAHPVSTGDYAPGLVYLLNATGNATVNPENDDEEALLSDTLNSTATTLNVAEDQDVKVNIDMGVWKSNRALVLLNVLNGTIEVGSETYNVELGYALYSVSHNVMGIGAFVSDEDGNIYKLKLRGSAIEEDSVFPTTSGDSIDMVFGGIGGPARNSFAQWDLDLDGTVEAS